jgi:shikimate dehydrogenase
MAVEARTALYAVWGDPVGHSLSPAIHNHAFAEHGVDAVYVAQQVRATDLAAAVLGARATGLCGWNLTLPHKEAVLPLLDELDPTAARIGAVNTVVRRDDGRLVGYNTDAAGFLEPLATRHDFHPAGRTAVLLGAGGAARAIAFGLATAGLSHLHLRNRTVARAEALAAELRRAFPALSVHTGSLADIADSVWTAADLVVQGTSAGHVGEAAPQPDPAQLPAHAIVADIGYGPAAGDWLAPSQAAGRRTLDGLWMLVGQAALAYRLWTGHSFELAAAYARLAGREQPQG